MMRDILYSYLIYNVLIGIVLSLVHLYRSKQHIRAVDLVWLLLFPAVGLGKWIHSRTVAKGEPVVFSEKWYVWKYMIKVNWGYLCLIAAAPVLFFLLMFFGVAVGGWAQQADMDLFATSDLAGIWEAGIAMLLLFGSLLLMLFLAIPYFILIHLPKSQLRSVEREHFYSQPKTRMQQSTVPAMDRKPTQLLPHLHNYVLECETAFKNIPSARKKELETLSAHIRQKIAQAETVNLTFICTHNSRRSQFAQIWAAVAAAYHGIKNVHTFSGGTEETAFNKRAVGAVKRAGFLIDGTVGTNPRYSVRFSDEAGALNCFSKKFDHSSNPQKGFFAITTCEEAAEACPMILGAEVNAHLFYQDPQFADRTKEEEAIYDQCCHLIATEMLYLFSKV